MIASERLGGWLQFLGGLSVLVGLLFVAYELKLTNDFAKAESENAMWEGWEALAFSHFEPATIAAVQVKAETDPESLTPEEMLQVGWWRVAIMAEYSRAHQQATLGLVDLDLHFETFKNNLPVYFGTAESRAWFEENRFWLIPRHAELIEEYIMATPAAPPLEWHRKNMESIRYQMQRKAGDPVFPPQQ